MKTMGVRFLWVPMLLSSGLLAEEERMAVQPADTGVALVNPGMGWTLHFYSNMIRNYGSKLEPSDTLDDWPGLSVVYLRVPWAFLEPAEGQFNWSLFDTPAQRWIAKGRKIAMRVSCSESWMRYATRLATGWWTPSWFRTLIVCRASMPTRCCCWRSWRGGG